MKLRYVALVVLLLCAASVFAQSAPHDVVLTWTESDTASGITYNVYRGTSTGSCTTLPAMTKINTATVTVMTYTDTSVVLGGSYCYAVTAVYNGLESAMSVGAGATINKAAPPTINITIIQ